MPLLQEYFYNDWDRLRAVVGNRFVKPATVDEATRQALGDFDDMDDQYQVYEYEAGSAFLEAISTTAAV